jgi:amidase
MESLAMQTFAATDLKYVYSREHEPIGTVQPGERFVVDTADCFTGRYRDPTDFSPESAAWVDANLNPVTGPIRIEGAQPREAVEIHIEDIAVTTPASVVISRCAALSPADWWHEEEYAVSLTVADGQIRIRDNWSVPVRPLIGCLATAPRRETILSRHEGNDYGGNMDCSAITAGATVILPVEVAGGLLYFGDCKASMGAGEVTCSPEVGTRIVASATPVPRPASMQCPRIRTGTHLTTIVSGISLADACRTAFSELKLWLEDEWQVAPDDAAVIMGIAADCGVCQVSNQLHTATCTLARALLPPPA